MSHNMKHLFLCTAFVIGLLITLTPPPVHGQQQSRDETHEGIVVSIASPTSEQTDTSQILTILITSGSQKGKKVTIDTGAISLPNSQRYQIGDRLVLLRSTREDNTDLYLITDVVRRTALYVLFALFVVLTILVGGKGGMASLGGMALSFAIIFMFILPPFSLAVTW